MANKSVKGTPTGTMGKLAAKRSRYEKMEVAYGQIKVNANTPDIVIGDTAVFDQIPMRSLIEGRFVTNASTPDELNVFTAASDTDAAVSWTVAKDTTTIDYVVSYIRGTGHDGDGNARTGQAGYLLAIDVMPNAAVVVSKSATPGAVPGTTCALSTVVTSQGSAATVTFEYGPTTGYGTEIAAAVNGTIAAGVTGNTTATKTITGLTAATLYHYRVNITNAAGEVNSTDGTFTTAAAA